MGNSKRFFTLLLSFLFIVFLIEGMTRLFFKITNKDIDVYRNFSFARAPKIFIPDYVLGYKLIPNVSRNALSSDFQVIYKTNSIGLREKEIEDTDKFKILFLGDSMTFGEGVTYGSRFSDLIEKEIKNVYTINAGVPGYGIHQMYLWLKYYGLILKPDLVICSIIPHSLQRVIKELETPLHLLIRQQKSIDYSESKAKHFSKVFITKLDGLLMKKSYLYPLAKVKVKVLLLCFYLKERDKIVRDRINKKGERYKITAEEQREMIKEKSTKIFLDFKDMCDRVQVNFLVVNVSTESLPWLLNFLTEHNIEYLDLSHQLSKIYNKIRFEIDPHYNALGNRMIAHFLREYILNRYKDEKTNLQNISKF